MAKRYFAAIGDKTKGGTGWPLAFCSGNSISDFKDWSIECLGFKADELQDCWNDAKDFAQLVAGLLNAYYNDMETRIMDEKQLIRLGKPLVELNIPHPSNPELPF